MQPNPVPTDHDVGGDERPSAAELERAMAKLKSFREGDLGVLDVVACGNKAIPALRTMLIERERSGLYQARCRAVAALAALGAFDVLIAYLEAERGITDAVEQLGEDAVINAAAQALASSHDPRVLPLLLRLARRPSLTGVIGALGAFGNADAVPALVDALEDDASRPTAEAALRKFGRAARTALLNAATRQTPSSERESQSSLRRRRSALGLLAGMPVAREAWRLMRQLMDDGDAKVAALACEIHLRRGPPAVRPLAVRRLIGLLASEDWVLRERIADVLTAHLDAARSAITDRLREGAWPGEPAASAKRTVAILHRVLAGTEPTVPRPTQS